MPRLANELIKDENGWVFLGIDGIAAPISDWWPVLLVDQLNKLGARLEKDERSDWICNVPKDDSFRPVKVIEDGDAVTAIIETPNEPTPVLWSISGQVFMVDAGKVG